MKQKIYHLSHTDLDGYASQYMTRFLQNETTTVSYFNAGYNEVLSGINSILSDISLDPNSIKLKIILLITDLSINSKQLKKLNNFKKSNNHLDFNFLIIDHHQAKIDEIDNLENYILDTNECASSLTAQYMKNLHSNKELQVHLTLLGDIVKAFDIWKPDSPYFNISNLLSIQIDSIKFPNFLNSQFKREIIFYYIFFFLKAYENECQNLNELEMVQSIILRKTIEMVAQVNNVSIYLDSEKSSFVNYCSFLSKLYIKDSKDEIFSFNGLKYKILYNIDNGLFQYISHNVLNELEIDFIVNIKPSGHINFRSENNIDVDLIAKNHFENGGGHKNAAGGVIPNITNKIQSYSQVVKIMNRLAN